MPSLARRIAALTPEQQKAMLDSLTPQQQYDLQYDWSFWGRAKQQPPPGDWRTWLILSGRGWGKSRCAAEFVKSRVESGKYHSIALIGETAKDVRDVMVEQNILRYSRPSFYPKYEPSKCRLTWPNGAMAYTYSAEEPDQLRGPQHDLAWIDELAKYRYPQLMWDNLQMGLRLGTRPQTIVTSTPRPIALIKRLIIDPSVVVTGGSTYENQDNLSASFIHHIKQQYEGTRLGRQELYAELLSDVPGALWSRDLIESTRIKKDELPELVRIVIAVDPSVTSNENSDEVGIIVGGVSKDKHAYIIGDLSGVYSPDAWAKITAGAYKSYEADRVICEVNQGGDLVETVLRTIDANLPIKKIHASKSKQSRAEPIAALSEQRKVHFVGCFNQLEDELCSWVQGNKSPNRLDSFVYCVTELLLNGKSYTTDIKFDMDFGVQESYWRVYN